MYDFLLNEFNWNGIDNQGKSMNCVVNLYNGADYVNAYWDGTNANFGAGSCHYDPLTTLDVVGHEFQHGITQATANLYYLGEPGAISEAVCDIMGKALEYEYDRDNFTWVIGNKFTHSPHVEAFRSMKDPNSFKDPAFYRGDFWHDSGNSHTNAGVMNRWFYLLVEGGADTTDLGDPYKVEALGMDKSVGIVFKTVTQYMTELTDYPIARQLTLLAAEELYGVDSAELKAIEAAWFAVGLPSYLESQKFDLSFTGLNYGLVGCYDEEYYPFTLILTNEGDSTIAGGTKLDYTVGGYLPVTEHTITLEEDFLPGQRLAFKHDSLLYINRSGFHNVSATLDLIDNIRINNNTQLGLENVLYEEPDFAITDFNAILLPDCTEVDFELELEYKNNSCALLPKGTPYSLTVTRASEILYQEFLELEYDLYPTEKLLKYIKVKKHADFLYYRITLDAALDFDADNNVETIKPDFLPSLSIPYENLLNEPADLDKNITVSFDRRTNLVEYQNETMLAVSNYGVEFLCPDAFDNLFNSGEPYIQICADFTGIEEPTLSFDLAQFRSDYDWQNWEENQYYVMMAVVWNSDRSFGSRWYFDQPKGEVLNHKIDFHDNFNGNIEFRFFSFRGTGGNTSSDILEGFDINLLNNIRFYDNGLATKVNDVDEKEITVYPNPAQTDLNLIFEDQSRGDIEIVDCSGKLVLQQKLYSKTININTLGAGLYFLKYYSPDYSKVSTTKFFKL